MGRVLVLLSFLLASLLMGADANGVSYVGEAGAWPTSASSVAVFVSIRDVSILGWENAVGSCFFGRRRVRML